jgi:hypothetical protein
LPEDTSLIPGFDWQWVVFLRRPNAAMWYSFLFMVPLLFGAYMTYQLYVPTLAILSPWLMLAVFPVYWRLSATSTRPAYVIARDNEGKPYIDEQQWWKWDHYRFPEDCKMHMVSEKGGSLYPYRVPWIDARDGNLRVVDPDAIPLVFEVKTTDDKKLATSANIIGVESLSQSNYLFAKYMPNADMLAGKIPWLLILAVSFGAVFMGANRIASMMGVE